MAFPKKLILWYSINKRQLPWRETTDPYFIWLSEIILQQTQVNQGLPYYEAFTLQFPSIFHLADAKESDVLKLWQGLGYYSRARNLHATAKYIVSNLNGKFPNNYKDLIKLKGVGDYTASAIASICFNEATAVVDGNVYRVLARYFGVSTAINSTKGKKEFKQLAQELIDKKDPASFNQALMEFGATQCKPQNPDCSRCPFITNCVAFAENKISEFPVKIKAAKAKIKFFNFLVLLSKNQKTLLQKREGKGIWQNLYQFPLIELDKNTEFEEFYKLIKNHDLLKNVTFEVSLFNQKAIVHKLSHQHLHTKFWIVKINSNLNNGVSICNINSFAVPILIGNFIETFNFSS